MGVTVIQERNALSDFLRGLSPIVDAWGQRYKERGKANILNEVEQYQNAKPQFMDVGAIAGDAYRPASAEMFSDTGNMGGYSGVSPQVNTQTSPEELMRMVNPGTLGEIAKAYNFNSTAQADFDKNRAVQKADLQKRGADYFGGTEARALLEGADKQRRYDDLASKVTLGTPYQDIMRAAGGVSLANGDLAGAVSAFGGLKPNVGQSSINLGGKTVLLKHDPANPGASSYEFFDNSATPGQVMNDNQQNLNRDWDRDKTISGRKFTSGENALNRQARSDAEGSKEDIAVLNAISKYHTAWMKANPNKPASESPYYAEGMALSKKIKGGSGEAGAGTGDGKPAPLGPQYLDKQEHDRVVQNFINIMAKKGYLVSASEASLWLQENKKIFPKVSAVTRGLTSGYTPEDDSYSND